MKAKILLNEILKRNKIIKYKLEELERQKNLCEIKGLSYDADKVQTSGANGTDGNIIEYVQLKDELQKYINDTLKLKHDLMNFIDEMTNERLITVLYKKYFEEKSFNEIAKDLNVSYSRVQQLHDKAVNELEKIIENLFKL